MEVLLQSETKQYVVLKTSHQKHYHLGGIHLDFQLNYMKMVNINESLDLSVVLNAFKHWFILIMYNQIESKRLTERFSVLFYGKFSSPISFSFLYSGYRYVRD
jgi:hypothetical protein